MFAYLLIGITYAFAAAIQPGPLQTFIVLQTLKNGWKRNFPAAFAPVLNDIPVIILVRLVLSNIPADLMRFLFS